jgi:hypothetical protein
MLLMRMVSVQRLCEYIRIVTGGPIDALSVRAESPLVDALLELCRTSQGYVMT